MCQVWHCPGHENDGATTFWGQEVSEDEADKIKALLGVDRELHTPGENADQTEIRQAALEIAEDPAAAGLNARQTMLKWKEAHGSGRNLDFPSAEDIISNMQGLPDDYMVDIFGDGSQTTPTKWWAAMGGYGVWGSKVE